MTPEHALQQHRAQEIVTSPDASAAALLAAAAPERIDTPDADTLLRGPERIESGWWDGGEVLRDYYLARSRRARGLGISRSACRTHWYLQGLWV